MTRFHPTLRGRTMSIAVAAASAALGAVMLTSSVSATANQPYPAVPAPPAHPTRVDQIQNIDQVKTAIKGYYGDQIDPDRVNPIDGTPIHTFDPAGAYAHEMDIITTHAMTYLARKADSYPGTKKAVIFDVDDTTLNTYSYEIYSNFVYNPTSNAAFVNGNVFRAVPHMVELEHYAQDQGYAIFFLTGRPGGTPGLPSASDPDSQRAGTLRNLRQEGFTLNATHLYLKDNSLCTPACTSTTQRKTAARRYIESMGYTFAADFGDQFSDLNGGHAGKRYKIPNPMYYLP